MGTSNSAESLVRRLAQLREAPRLARLETKRKELADKIVMAVVDKIVADIVRPGPTPEERECYEMAGELRAIGPQLQELVAAIIKVEAEEGGSK